jgi:hypothetical protein
MRCALIVLALMMAVACRSAKPATEQSQALPEHFSRVVPLGMNAVDDPVRIAKVDYTRNGPHIRPGHHVYDVTLEGPHDVYHMQCAEKVPDLDKQYTLAVSSEEEAVQMDIPSKVDCEYTYHLIDNGTEVERFRCLLVEAEKNAVDSHDPLKIR